MKARMNNSAMVIPDAMQALRAWGRARRRTACRRRRSALSTCARARSMVAAPSSPCTLSSRRRRERRTSGSSRWRPGGTRPISTTPSAPRSRSTEAVTRLSDRADPVPDEVWLEAARHYDEPALAALLIAIATVNVWNRLNVATRGVAGEWAKSAEARAWLESHSGTR